MRLRLRPLAPSRRSPRPVSPGLLRALWPLGPGRLRESEVVPARPAAQTSDRLTSPSVTGVRSVTCARELGRPQLVERWPLPSRGAEPAQQGSPTSFPGPHEPTCGRVSGRKCPGTTVLRVSAR